MTEVLKRGALVCQGSVCFAFLRNDLLRVFLRLKCIRSFQITADTEVSLSGLNLSLRTVTQEVKLTTKTVEEAEQWKAAFLGSVRMESHFSSIACLELKEGQIVYKHSMTRRSKRFVWLDFSARELRWSRKNSKRHYSSFNLAEVKKVQFGGCVQLCEPSHCRVAIVTCEKVIELELPEQSCEAWVVALPPLIGVQGLSHSQFVFRKAALKLGDWSLEWPLAFRERLVQAKPKLLSCESSIFAELPSEFESFSLPAFTTDQSTEAMLQNTSRFPEIWDSSSDYMSLKDKRLQQASYVSELEHALKCEREANATLCTELTALRKKLNQEGLNKKLQETERQHDKTQQELSQLKLRLQDGELTPRQSFQVCQGKQSAVRHEIRTLKLQVEELREEVVDQYEQFQEVWPHVVYLLKTFGSGLRRGKENSSRVRKSLVG